MKLRIFISLFFFVFFIQNLKALILFEYEEKNHSYIENNVYFSKLSKSPYLGETSFLDLERFFYEIRSLSLIKDVNPLVSNGGLFKQKNIFCSEIYGGYILKFDNDLRHLLKIAGKEYFYRDEKDLVMNPGICNLKKAKSMCIKMIQTNEYIDSLSQEIQKIKEKNDYKNEKEEYEKEYEDELNNIVLLHYFYFLFFNESNEESKEYCKKNGSFYITIK